MHSVADIFQIFGADSGAVTTLAGAIKEKVDTVYRWSRRGRIPETAWESIIRAAESRGAKLTASDILSANKPARRRGRKPRGRSGKVA
jgi:hypothetical protein